MIRRAINRLEEALLAIFLAVMTLLTFVQVVLRYVFNTGLVWSLEATTYAFAWMVLIGMSYGIRTGSHMAVDAVVRTLRPKARRAVALTSVLFCLAYVGFMAYGAYLYVDRLHTMGHLARDIAVPRWLLSAIAPVGFLLLGFRLLEAGWKIGHGDRASLGSGEEPVGVIDGGDKSPDDGLIQ